MLKLLLSPYADRAYALLRIVSGAIFLMAGTPKVFNVLAGQAPQPTGSQLWFGGLIEIVTGLALLVGFLKRWAAFLASGTMAVAYFQFHHQWSGKGFLPTVNGGAPAVVLCFVFLAIACKDAGPWSIDACRERMKAKDA
jgi:putative oxidoreductase